MSVDSYSVKSPTISIIVPVHNAEMDLPRCLDSLCTQSYENYEIICVENASTDGSWHVLQQYAAQNERIKLMRRDKAGVSGARNTALELVQGDIVGFCDADDMYTQGAFQYVVESFKLKGCDILTTGYKAVTSPPPRLILARKSY